MVIKAYVRLQDCTSNDSRAFVPRSQEAHGIAKRKIAYYAVEGGSWSAIKRVLKSFGVIGWVNLDRNTVQAWSQDVGAAVPKLHRLYAEDIPLPALFDQAKHCKYAPFLTSFGPEAVEAGFSEERNRAAVSA